MWVFFVDRFGLYGYLFDFDLFDIELFLVLKQIVFFVFFIIFSISSSNFIITGNINNNLIVFFFFFSVIDELDYYDLFNFFLDKF